MNRIEEKRAELRDAIGRKATLRRVIDEEWLAKDPNERLAIHKKVKDIL